MQLDLLWIEIILKSATGAVLLLFPRTLARILGLPPVSETFWPRLLGATLIGLAAATVLEGQVAKSGLGLAGHVAINFAAVLALIGLLIMGKAGRPSRARIVLVVTVLALSLLALVELAYV